MNRRIAAITNPYAAGGRVGKMWPQIAQKLRGRLGELALRQTDSAGHATQIARDLIESGYDLIIAVGGDGTMNEVANGFLREDEPLNPEATLGIFPVGTGADFQRTLGVPSSVDRAIDILAEGRALAIDVGKIRFTGQDGSPCQRYLVNLASFGMGGDVAATVKNHLAVFGGKTAFMWATLKTLARYRGRRVEIEIDNCGKALPFFITNVAVGNGQYHGGGMHPCPYAVVDDGLLEVTVIDYLKLFELVRDIRVLYSDNIYSHPKVHHLRARRIVATADEPTQIEVDGEPLGRLPLEIEVLPRRLPVLLSPSSPLFNISSQNQQPSAASAEGTCR